MIIHLVLDALIMRPNWLAIESNLTSRYYNVSKSSVAITKSSAYAITGTDISSSEGIYYFDLISAFNLSKMLCITRLKRRGDNLSPYLTPLSELIPSNKSFS